MKNSSLRIRALFANILFLAFLSPNTVFATKSLADITPPSRVSTLNAQTLKVNSIQLRWMPSYDDFTDKQNIEYSVFRAEMTSDSPPFFRKIATLKGTTLFLDETLTRRGYFAYYVVSKDESGNFSYTSPIINATN